MTTDEMRTMIGQYARVLGDPMGTPWVIAGVVDDRTWLLRHRVTGEFREAATGETLRRRPR